MLRADAEHLLASLRARLDWRRKYGSTEHNPDMVLVLSTLEILMASALELGVFDGPQDQQAAGGVRAEGAQG